MELIGIQEADLFQELESAMSIDKLTTPGELDPMQIQNAVGNLYGLEVAKFHTAPIPEEGRLNLKTLYLQHKYLNMAAEDPGVKSRRRRMLREFNDNWFQSQPPPPKVFSPELTDRKSLFCVRVYRPFKQINPEYAVQRPMYQQEFWMLGEHTLADLKDRIRCPVDFNIVGKQQVDLVHKPAQRAADVYKSCYIYVNGCFYNDTRDKDNIDLSRTIRDWVAQGKSGLGPFTTGSMETTALQDLELRVGCPYVYVHQGEHEHLVTVYDVRLVGPEDPQSLGAYPLLRSIDTPLSQYCMTCQAETAMWVTENNTRVPEDPYFFCSNCYKRFNFVNGKRVGSFNEHKYLDINSI